MHIDTISAETHRVKLQCGRNMHGGQQLAPASRGSDGERKIVVKSGYDVHFAPCSESNERIISVSWLNVYSLGAL